jgi:hemolysin activation/secretion protein
LQQVTLAWGVTAGIASSIDRSQVYHLGLDSGLRAARYRELSGDRLLRGNAELRLTKTSGLLRLVTPGVVVFSDFGSAWFEDDADFRWDQVRGAYGVGLRLGLTRAAADVPIRIDFAWPMLYPTEQPSPVISIGTGQIF